MLAAFAWLGVPVPGFILRCANTIPHGRGLGSSAAAIIGGIVLARAMVADGRERMTDSDVLQLALRQEAHPDNLAAALLRGLHGRLARGRRLRRCGRGWTRIPTCTRWCSSRRPSCATTKARALLPAGSPFADAARNVSRSALLVHAMTVDPRRLMSGDGRPAPPAVP